MVLNMQELSKKDRFLIVATFFWFVIGLIFSLYLLDEENLENYEFLLLFLIILSPPIIYWSYRWILGGEKSERKKEKERNKFELIKSSPTIENNVTIKNINSYVIAIIVFYLFIVFGFAADLVVNEYLKSQAQLHGWGKIPLDIPRNAESWSSAIVYFRVLSGVACIIAILIAYKEAKAQITEIGISGLTCSVGWFIAWIIIPFANLVMPWRALGSLDRATKFAAIYGRKGDQWNAKGIKWISWRAVFVGVCFVIAGTSSTLINKAVVELSQKEPTSIYHFYGIINENNLLISITIAVYLLFGISIVVYFGMVNKNLKKIGSESIP